MVAFVYKMLHYRKGQHKLYHHHLPHITFFAPKGSRKTNILKLNSWYWSCSCLNPACPADIFLVWTDHYKKGKFHTQGPTNPKSILLLTELLIQGNIRMTGSSWKFCHTVLGQWDMLGTKSGHIHKFQTKHDWQTFRGIQNKNHCLLVMAIEH